jgi:hypothetical protein
MAETRVAPDAKRYFTQRRGLLALWAGLLLPPFAWFLNLQLSYMLVLWACATGRQFILYVVTLAMLVLAISGGAIAWHTWQRVGRDSAGEAEGVVARSRFMAVGGWLSSVMFSLAIVAQGIPSFILSACEP